MSFLYPQVLALLLLPVALGIAALVWRRRTGKGWTALVSSEHPELVNRAAAWRSVLPPLLMLPAIVCTILALARPINGYKPGKASASGRNLLIALDISRSMETADVAPSRGKSIT